MKIVRKYHFYAAHRNREADQKCGRIHGHTYDVECTFSFDEFDGDVAMLFGELDKITEPLIKYYDHYFILHDKDPLARLLDEAGEPYRPLPFVTSAENMAKHLFDEISQFLPITLIRFAETKSGYVEYQPPHGK